MYGWDAEVQKREVEYVDESSDETSLSSSFDGDLREYMAPMVIHHGIDKHAFGDLLDLQYDEANHVPTFSEGRG